MTLGCGLRWKSCATGLSSDDWRRLLSDSKTDRSAASCSKAMRIAGFALIESALRAESIVSSTN